MEIRQTIQDRIEILFNPLKEKLEPGESLKILEKGDEKRGLIVQIIELKTIDYRSLIEEQLREVAVEQFQMENLVVEEDLGMLDMKNLKIAMAKIRKEIKIEENSEKWIEWKGWIPTRNVEVIKIDSSELISKLVEEGPSSLTLGKTLDGVDLKIKGQNIEKVNVITSVKGAGKSHLAKGILLQLIQQGGQCIVFDLNKEYGNLPQEKGIVPLTAGDNLKLSIVDFGLSSLVYLMQNFGLPETSAGYFINTFKNIFEMAQKKNEFIPFEALIEESNTKITQSYVRAAIERVLHQINMVGVFANEKGEAESIQKQLQNIKDGGGLIIDISGLSKIVLEAFVPAVIDKLKEIIRGGKQLFLFFEEAHSYLKEHHIFDLITRIRHLGATTIFITNMVTSLPEVVLRQLDNLFLLKLPHERDVSYVSAGAPVDDESIRAFSMRLPLQEAILIGKATSNYPIRFKPAPLEEIKTAGETKYFFPE